LLTGYVVVDEDADMQVWFLRDGLALAVCKHPTEDTNHNSSKIS
jgi:hypothetical protein